MEAYKLGRKTDTEIGPNKLHAWNHSLYGRKNGCQISLNLPFSRPGAKDDQKRIFVANLSGIRIRFGSVFTVLLPFWERPESMNTSSLTFFVPPPPRDFFA